MRPCGVKRHSSRSSCTGSGRSCPQSSSTKFTMASNNTVPVLPNPFTPLAFLPPVLADQFEVSCFVVVAGLAVSTQLKYGPQLTLSWLCRLMCGTASCLCRKSIKSSTKVDLPLCQASLISCHGQFNIRKFHQALTLLCSIGTLGFTVSSTVFQGNHINFPA